MDGQRRCLVGPLQSPRRLVHAVMVLPDGRCFHACSKLWDNADAGLSATENVRKWLSLRRMGRSAATGKRRGRRRRRRQ
jgi:hypothetical protein